MVNLCPRSTAVSVAVRNAGAPVIGANVISFDNADSAAAITIRQVAIIASLTSLHFVIPADLDALAFHK